RGKKIILFLSRINFKKGLDILARAFGEVARKRDDVYLVLAGPDNEGYGAKVRAWLQEEGALGRSIFTGMLLGEEKLAALRDSDIFVLPSYTENFGIAVVEAMACGLPVIISNKVNIWGEVSEVGAGIITDCDSHQVAETIARLLDDRNLREEMGERGKKLVEEKYTWPEVAKEMIEVYEQILDSHRANRFRDSERKLDH
ncbi:MAG: glycosyltransferase, partial [Clostridia bacterium]|nr:glycosyltransferase [Clostridia bacterium]